jgi:hypothetical protein
MQDYRFLSKPLLLCIMLYFMGSNTLRYIMYLLLLIHLSTESYQICQSKIPTTELTYITKFWILFAILLTFDFINLMFFDNISMPMLTNFIRFAYLAFLTYHPNNVIIAFKYMEPYLASLSNIYSTFLIYAVAILV